MRAPDPPRLLLLRHAESTWNASGRWQGWADPPLSPAGAEAAARLAGSLAPLGFTVVWSSPLSRARRTAEILASALGLPPPRLDERLKERDVGAWAGLTDAEIAARWSGEPARWRARQDTAPPGGGEDARTVAGRALECVTRLARSPDRVLVVCHGGVIRTLDHATGGSGVLPANLAGLWFAATGEGLRSTGVFAPAGS